MSIANAKGISMIMLEGKEMLQYIEERAAIENLDGLFIGPADLSAIKDAASTKLADLQRV